MSFSPLARRVLSSPEFGSSSPIEDMGSKRDPLETYPTPAQILDAEEARRSISERLSKTPSPSLLGSIVVEADNGSFKGAGIPLEFASGKA